jgi:signal transduction histidine kinase
LNAPAGDQIDLLAGLLPLNGQPVVLPHVEISPGIFAHVHLNPGDSSDLVLIVDATEEANQLRAVQQQKHELQLRCEHEARETSVAQQVIAEMDALLLHRVAPDRFVVQGKIPGWLALISPSTVTGGEIRPMELFPFLASFEDEANENWELKKGPPIKSGTWTETDSTGAVCHLEASAMHVLGRTMLVIQRADPDRILLLQRARTSQLRAARDLSLSRVEKERLLKESERAAIANTAKAEFLAGMGHELRAPLQAMLGYAALLSDEAIAGGASDQSVEDLRRIYHAGHHLLDLVDQILDLSRAEAGKMRLEVEPFDVVSMVNEVIDTARPLVVKNENSIALQCGPGVGEMQSDLLKLRQSLLNLIGNAAKFTSRGTIEVRVTRDGEWIEFAVADTGMGLDAGQMGLLFEPFVQADRSNRFGGTGLGLAISRQMCRLLGGDISVKSEPGKGSTFTIRLPARIGGDADKK